MLECSCRHWSLAPQFSKEAPCPKHPLHQWSPIWGNLTVQPESLHLPAAVGFGCRASLTLSTWRSLFSQMQGVKLSNRAGREEGIVPSSQSIRASSFPICLCSRRRRNLMWLETWVPACCRYPNITWELDLFNKSPANADVLDISEVLSLLCSWHTRHQKL